MTQIVFDNNGKPYWVRVPASGAYLHNVEHYATLATADAERRTEPFTEADLDWFRKPIRVG